MATFERRYTKNGQIHWRVRIRCRGHRALSKTFMRKADARCWARQTEADMQLSYGFTAWEHQHKSAGEAIDRYLRDIVPRYGDSGKGRSQHLYWWKARIGDTPLIKVSPALIAGYRDELSQAITVRHTVRAPATVNRYLSSLGHVFTVAVKEWGWLDRSPLKCVFKLKEPSGRARFLSDAERERLLDACRDSPNCHLYLAVVLALSTAARRMEIMRLRWKDVDLENERLIFHRTKNGDYRTVPVQGHALYLLKQKLHTADTALLFPGVVKPDKPINLRVAWEHALNTAAITDFRWHDLRHSSASYLAMSGATLIELSDILGHRTLQMVKRYSHLSENHTAGIIADMNQRIFSRVAMGQKRDGKHYESVY